MYTEEYLSSYPFFQDCLKENSLTSLHDSLTGLIARPFTIQFIHSLIWSGTPFTLSILDLDNFKNINDTYGHEVGDQILMAVARKLIDAVGTDGIVGRFGGDEFLLLHFKITEYDAAHKFYEQMFDLKQVFRRTYLVEGKGIFVTGTVGCASYPKDAKDYEDLFYKIDKTLYRGKSKGRNCFIIYVKEKHQNLEITKLARSSLYHTFFQMSKEFDKGSDALDRLSRGFGPFREYLRLYEAYYVDRSWALHAVAGGQVINEHCLIHEFTGGEEFTPSVFDELREVSPTLYGVLSEKGYESVLLVRVRSSGQPCGYIVICPEPHTLRIWQDEELAAAYFLARLVGGYLSSQADPS